MRRCAAAALVLFLAACEGLPTAPAEESAATKEAGYGRAFGRVEYLEEGKEKVRSENLLRIDTLTLFVRPARGGQLLYMDIPRDGSFSWPLKAGDYTILGYQWVTRSAATSYVSGRLMMTFSIPEAGQAVYIGDLRINASAGRMQFAVLDHYSVAAKAVADRTPDGSFAPAKGLVRSEVQPGKYARESAICQAFWSLDCDSTYRGIRPLEDSPWNHRREL